MGQLGGETCREQGPQMPGEGQGWCWRQVDSGVAPPDPGHAAHLCLAGHAEATSWLWAASAGGPPFLPCLDYAVTSSDWGSIWSLCQPDWLIGGPALHVSGRGGELAHP